ncbi:cation diffusion facilitator family transporter [uncultured Ruminococcus sp.]|uniref:cation diffusion facilitator family transporter n=1 Tax=uncultured Ruminococcus sp. TaxID=165186 RepID=UPI0029310372|nr:cation diffusion facilitator family transporter [uncultured Ruminococcus sp.]
MTESNLFVSGGRRRAGSLVCLTNAALNLLLFLLKFTAGIIAGSVAATADGFNHLADACSCVLAALGFWLSGKRPSRRYPLGFGRIEYLSGLLMSLLILFIGGKMLCSSVIRIIHPRHITYSPVLLIILLISVAVKGGMYLYNRHKAKLLRSSVIKAEAVDSLSDCCATILIIVAVICEKLTGLHIDGWAGIPVALCILYAGIMSAHDGVAPLLGSAIEPKTARMIRRIVTDIAPENRVTWLILHDYGPERRLITFYLIGDNSAEIISEIRKRIKHQLKAEAIICPITSENKNDEGCQH